VNTTYILAVAGASNFSAVYFILSTFLALLTYYDALLAVTWTNLLRPRLRRSIYFAAMIFFLFLPRDTRNARRSVAVVSRPSVRPSVCLFVTLLYRGCIGFTSSKLITDRQTDGRLSVAILRASRGNYSILFVNAAFLQINRRFYVAPPSESD